MEQAVERWEKTMGINVTSIFLGQNAVIPHDRAGGSGAGPYTASKGTVRMLTKATAVDYAKRNIRANLYIQAILKLQ